MLKSENTLTGVSSYKIHPKSETNDQNHQSKCRSTLLFIVVAYILRRNHSCLTGSASSTTRISMALKTSGYANKGAEKYKQRLKTTVFLCGGWNSSVTIMPVASYEVTEVRTSIISFELNIKCVGLLQRSAV